MLIVLKTEMPERNLHVSVCLKGKNYVFIVYMWHTTRNKVVEPVWSPKTREEKVRVNSSRTSGKLS